MTTIAQPAIEKPKSRIGEMLLASFHGVAVLAAFLVLLAAYRLGFLFNALFVLLLILAVAGVCSKTIGACFKSLEFRLLRRPFARDSRKYLFQCLNRWTFLALAAFTVQLAVIPAQFQPEQYRSIQVMLWGATGLSILLALIPHRTVRISTNSFFAVGWLFLGVELFRIFLPMSNSSTVALSPPFRGEWYVFHGGRSSLINHHYPVDAQRYALDIIKTTDGREVQDDKTKLETHPAYGQTLYAPANGTVAKVVNDRPDMPIGKTDLDQIVGNHLVLDIGQGRFVLMAHLKQGSVRVAPGDSVRRGQAVAECGNSGNTSGPHLHLQVQSSADFHSSDLRTFPILFRDVTRVRWGRRAQLKEADVRRNDILLAPETVATQN